MPVCVHNEALHAAVAARCQQPCHLTHSRASSKAVTVSRGRSFLSLCCGRWCGLWTGPLKRYVQAFAAQRFLPDLAITNHMNHEAILQVGLASVCKPQRVEGIILAQDVGKWTCTRLRWHVHQQHE